MNSSTVISRRAVIARAVTIIAAVAGAVALPQAFHLIGAASGTGAAVGTALLPMHIPVILAGLLGGPVVGMIAGVLSPVVGFLISGMPAAALLPFMMLELGVYGLVSGLLCRAKLNSFVKLLIVQAAGRIARAGAVLAAVYIFGNTALSPMATVEFITAGLFGILLQWALIPLLSEKLEGVKRLYE